MSNSKSKFKAHDWDGGGFISLPNNIVEAIYEAWNYEFDVYEVETDELIFTGQEDNETNSKWLEPYGIRIIDHGSYRKIQNIETGEIYEVDWHSNKIE